MMITIGAILILVTGGLIAAHALGENVNAGAAIVFWTLIAGSAWAFADALGGM